MVRNSRKKDPLKHYTCEDCGVIRRRRTNAKQPPRKFCMECGRKPENWVHGSCTTYDAKGCRCRLCKDAVALRHRIRLRNYEKINGIPYEFKRKTWYNKVCSSDTCYEVFTSSHQKVKFCSSSCSSRQIRVNERRSKTVPVLYDPVFAIYQQKRIDSGLYLPHRRPRYWISDDDRLRFYIEFNFTCQNCGIVCDSSSSSRSTSPTIDHALSWNNFLSNDPLRDDWANLLLMCHQCNSVKQDRFTNRAWITLLVRCGDMSVIAARNLRKARALKP